MTALKKQECKNAWSPWTLCLVFNTCRYVMTLDVGHIFDPQENCLACWIHNTNGDIKIIFMTWAKKSKEEFHALQKMFSARFWLRFKITNIWVVVCRHFSLWYFCKILGTWIKCSELHFLSSNFPTICFFFQQSSYSACFLCFFHRHSCYIYSLQGLRNGTWQD